MRGPAKVTAVVATALSAGILGSGVAFAGWFESAPTVTGELTTATMPGFVSRPGVELSRKDTVTVQWFAQRVAKKVPVQRYVVTRYNAVTGVHEQVCGESVTGTRCKDTGVPVGTWEYTVRTAQYRWTGPESRHSDPVTIAGPAVTADPKPSPSTTVATFEPAPVSISPSPSVSSVSAQPTVSARPNPPSALPKETSSSITESQPTGPPLTVDPDE